MRKHHAAPLRENLTDFSIDELLRRLNIGLYLVLADLSLVVVQMEAWNQFESSSHFLSNMSLPLSMELEGVFKTGILRTVFSFQTI